MAAEARFTINNTPVKVTYVGADCLRLREIPTRKQLKTLPLNGQVAYIRVFDGPKAQLFYADVYHQQLIPLQLSANEIQAFDTLTRVSALEFNQASALNLETIARIEKLTKYSAKASKKIKNIELHITSSAREDLLCRLFDGHATAKNATYTYIFQNQLAKYQGLNALNGQAEHTQQIDQWVQVLHDLSAQFIPFESLLQTQGKQSPEEVLQALEQHIKIYLSKVLTITEAYQRSHDAKTYPAIKELVTTLEHTLTKDCDNFLEQVQSMQHHEVTRDAVSRLLCVQTRDTNIRALGHFMATQMTAMLDTGIQVAYELSDNRFADLFHMPDAISAMSDAKAAIQLKAFSLDGAEYNETYMPIRQEMRDALTPAKAFQVPEAAEQQTPKWFSVMPYISHLNPSDLDKTICIATGLPFKQKHSASFYYQLGRIGDSIGEAFIQAGIALFQFIASAIELVLYVPVRLVLTLVLVAIDWVANFTLEVLSGVFTVLSYVPGLSVMSYVADWFDTSMVNHWISRADSLFSSGHDAISIVKIAKKIANSRYQRLSADGKILSDDHQKLIEACTEETNFFHQVFVYFNAGRISGIVKDFFSSFADALVGFFKNPLYLFSAPGYRAKPKEVYEMVQLRQQLQKLYVTRLKDTQLLASEEGHFASVRHLAVNEVSSPLEVFREIMLTLDDVVVDPMFRKSPGAATFYCMISTVTLGTYLAPAQAIAWMQSVPSWLQVPTDVLSIHFTGKPTSLGLMEQMVACFLEWKLGFFSTELLMEMQRGNFDFLSELVKEPEQVTLGLVGLIGMGVALQYLPLLPTTIKIPSISGMPAMPPIYNYYAEVLNLFIEEAKGCAEGTIGLTGVEYGFLGLKFAMLMHSMLAGAKPYTHQAAFQKLSLACSDAKFIEQIIHEVTAVDLLADENEKEIASKFDEILSRALNTVLAKKRLSDKFTRDDIQAFKTVLKAVVTKDAIREYQSIKNPEYRASEQNKLAPGDKTPKARFQAVLQTIKEAEEWVDDSAFLNAKHELEAAIALTANDEYPLICHGDPFKEANKFYDHLDSLFERYNEEAKALKKPELMMDKRAYLDVFYNKYCYRGSNNLLRSLLFFPVPIPFPPYYFPGVYMAVAMYRGLKYLVAKWQNKPSVAHQVVKSFNKDLVLLMQFASIIARTGQVFMRALGYLLRPIVALALFALTILPYSAYRAVAATGILGEQHELLTRKQWFKAIDEWASDFTRLHRIRLWEVGPHNWAKPIPTWPWQWSGNDIKKIITWPLRKMRVMYAQAARVAGSSDEISWVAKETLAHLEAVKVTSDIAETDTNSTYEYLHEVLQAPKKTSSIRQAPSNAHLSASKVDAPVRVSNNRASLFNSKPQIDSRRLPLDEVDESSQDRAHRGQEKGKK